MQQKITQQTGIAQQLTMTPRLAEAISLLAMPQTELAIWMQEQLESNPMLEELPETETLTTAPQTNSDDETLDLAQEKDLFEEDRRALEELERWDWQEYFDSVADGEMPGMAEPAVEDYYSATPDLPPNLPESLWSQLKLLTSDPEILAIGYEIIGALNDAGYLVDKLDDLAKRLGKPLASIENVLLEYIQTLEPAGVGARNLAECLQLQLRDKTIPPDDPVYAVVHHLDLIPQPQKLAKTLDINLNELNSAISLIKSLNPKPGLAFGSTPNQDIAPEIFVSLSGDKPSVNMEEWNIPTLTISPKYRSMIEHPENLPPETRQYLERMLGRALWIIRSVDRRRRTIFDIANHVFERQKEFLKKGPGALRPLTMQETADQVGVNVSTVSRAVANKYVQTPQGIFPFRHFFLGSLPAGGGAEVSSDAVQQKIKKLIDEEDPSHPYSDDSLAKLMAKSGIKVARRTITKYRHQMGIEDAASRRRIP